ncbi:MAG TPA: MXAN_6640 family putative metalloprotease, partial [Bacteroidota bacterium]|nr:MXAN_6640 family putative metalloprotease [Bacteroidota bacterium]
KYFNYVWSYEIDTLGYFQPPLDTDGYYHVYIIDLANSGIYGQTTWGTSPINTGQPPRYTTYIQIDKDFSTVYPPTRGIPALKVTAAHEFNHAIHIGSYGLWVNDFYFYELTATWMETVVFNDVKDYIQYLYQFDPNTNRNVAAGQFATPDVSFNAYSGLIEFSRGIWGCYVQKRFSRDVIRRAWELMQTFLNNAAPSIPAMDAALSEYGSSLRQAFLEWSVWNLHTGPDADTVKYYPDGRLYPFMQQRADVVYNGEYRSFADTIQALSSVYHPICILDSLHPTCNTSPKIDAIISNLNADAAGDGIGYGFQYDISPTGDQTYKPLGNGVFVKISASDPANWSSQEIETDSGSLIVPRYTEPLVCPDPFRPSGNKLLSFR